MTSDIQRDVCAGLEFLGMVNGGAREIRNRFTGSGRCLDLHGEKRVDLKKHETRNQSQL